MDEFELGPGVKHGCIPVTKNSPFNLSQQGALGEKNGRLLPCGTVRKVIWTRNLPIGNSGNGVAGVLESVPFKTATTLGWSEGGCGAVEDFPYHEPRRCEEMPKGPVAGTESNVVVDERVRVTSRDTRSWNLPSPNPVNNLFHCPHHPPRSLLPRRSFTPSLTLFIVRGSRPP